MKDINVVSMVRHRYSLLKTKSRSDDTLLTVDFNLRIWYDARALPSPAGMTLCACCAVPAGLRDGMLFYDRRLRYALPTVNKVLSLRDI